MSIHYPFPLLDHIDQVLPHIDEASFRVSVKDSGHTFINYVRMGSETFPPVLGSPDERLRAAIRRECRGIAFSTDTGALVSRPFHKFFNAEENENMTIGHMGFHMPHIVMDKIDGSMIRPLVTSHGLRWGTKAGITDTSNFAEQYVQGHPHYEKFALRCIEEGYTPIFEYVSPENRIVVDYGERDMVLLAIRETFSGLYVSHKHMVLIAEQFGIPLVRVFAPMDDDASVWIANMKAGNDYEEGVVFAWDNGHRAKVKTDLYNVLHKVKEAGRTERTLILALLDGRVDDLLAMLVGDDRVEVDTFINEFWQYIDFASGDVDVLFTDVCALFKDKKSFAISDFAKGLSQLERSVMFTLWDKKVEDSRAAVMGIIVNGLSSETAWDLKKARIEESANLRTFGSMWKTKEDAE